MQSRTFLLSYNMCLHKLASVDFGFWLSNFFGMQWKKVSFFKKSKKIQISKFRPDRKKIISEKSSSTKFLYPFKANSGATTISS
jgi:hypothetical protein